MINTRQLIGKLFSLGMIILAVACNIAPDPNRFNSHLEKMVFENADPKLKDSQTWIEAPCVVELFPNPEEPRLIADRQEYYNLNEFEGYYSEMVKRELKIKHIRITNKDTILYFRNQHNDRYIIDVSRIRAKQGLLFFNGPKPVFWKGDKAGELQEFVKEYYQKTKP